MDRRTSLQRYLTTLGSAGAWEDARTPLVQALWTRGDKCSATTVGGYSLAVFDPPASGGKATDALKPWLPREEASESF